jgi:hypothetical protein
MISPNMNLQGGTFGVVESSSSCGVVLARGVRWPWSKAVRASNTVLLEARRAAVVGSDGGAGSGDDDAGVRTSSALSLVTGLALLSLPTRVLVPVMAGLSPSICGPALSLPTGLVPGGVLHDGCTVAALSEEIGRPGARGRHVRAAGRNTGEVDKRGARRW